MKSRNKLTNRQSLQHWQGRIVRKGGIGGETRSQEVPPVMGQSEVVSTLIQLAPGFDVVMGKAAVMADNFASARDAGVNSSQQLLQCFR